MRRLPAATAGLLLLAIWAHALTGAGGAPVSDFFGRWMHDAVIAVAALACLVAMTRARRRPPGVGRDGHRAAADAGRRPHLLAGARPRRRSHPLHLGSVLARHLSVLVRRALALGAQPHRPDAVGDALDGLAGGLAIASVLACFTVSAAVEGSAGAPFWRRRRTCLSPSATCLLLGAIVSAGGPRRLADRPGCGRLLAAAIVSLETADLIYMTGADGMLGDARRAFVAHRRWPASPGPPRWRPARRERRRHREPRPVRRRRLRRGRAWVPVYFCRCTSTPVATGLAVAALAVVLGPHRARAAGERRAPQRDPGRGDDRPSHRLGQPAQAAAGPAHVLARERPMRSCCSTSTASRTTTAATATPRATAAPPARPGPPRGGRRGRRGLPPRRRRVLRAGAAARIPRARLSEQLRGRAGHPPAKASRSPPRTAP